MVVSTSGSQKSVVGAGPPRPRRRPRCQRYAVVYEAEDGADDDDEGVKVYKKKTSLYVAVVLLLVNTERRGRSSVWLKPSKKRAPGVN
jgi:hypothetical protein